MSEASFNEGANEGAPVVVQTAFIVIVDVSGKAWAVADVPPGVRVRYLPTHRAIKAACIEIADDIQAVNTAEKVALLGPAPEPTVGERIGTALSNRQAE